MTMSIDEVRELFTDPQTSWESNKDFGRLLGLHDEYIGKQIMLTGGQVVELVHIQEDNDCSWDDERKTAIFNIDGTFISVTGDSSSWGNSYTPEHTNLSAIRLVSPVEKTVIVYEEVR